MLFCRLIVGVTEMVKRPAFALHQVLNFLESLFDDDVHAKRVYSLANATPPCVSIDVA